MTNQEYWISRCNGAKSLTGDEKERYLDELTEELHQCDDLAFLCFYMFFMNSVPKAYAFKVNQAWGGKRMLKVVDLFGIGQITSISSEFLNAERCT